MSVWTNDALESINYIHRFIVTESSRKLLGVIEKILEKFHSLSLLDQNWDKPWLEIYELPEVSAWPVNK